MCIYMCTHIRAHIHFRTQIIAANTQRVAAFTRKRPVSLLSGMLASGAQDLVGLELVVKNNHFQAQTERMRIEQNRDLLLKNYNEALVNRRLGNENTTVIFNNRRVLLSSLNPQDPIGQHPVQTIFVQTKLEESQLDFLEHRSKLTSRVSAGELTNVVTSEPLFLFFS